MDTDLIKSMGYMVGQENGNAPIANFFL